MLRKGFELYKEGVLHARLAERNSDGADHLRKTLDARLLLKCCRAWQEFGKKHKKAKEYWQIVFTKVNTWELKWAFNRWNEGKNENKLQAISMVNMELQDMSSNIESVDKEMSLTLDREVKERRKAD